MGTESYPTELHSCFYRVEAGFLNPPPGAARPHMPILVVKLGY